jgi:hypothetical protein
MNNFVIKPLNRELIQRQYNMQKSELESLIKMGVTHVGIKNTPKGWFVIFPTVANSEEDAKFKLDLLLDDEAYDEI